jgi:hypothetical protein
MMPRTDGRWTTGGDWSRVPGAAEGTSFVAQTTTPLIVGEQGPERVTVTPGSGGDIPDLEEKAGSMAEAAAANAATAAAMTIPLTRHAEATSPDAEPRVDSSPLTDVYDRMHREQASAEAGPATLKSDELASIENASLEQVDHLADISAVLQEIKAGLAPSAGTTLSGQPPSPIEGSTAPQTTSWGSTDYGKWQFGRHAGNASNQVINDGVT